MFFRNFVLQIKFFYTNIVSSVLTYTDLHNVNQITNIRWFQLTTNTSVKLLSGKLGWGKSFLKGENVLVSNWVEYYFNIHNLNIFTMKKFIIKIFLNINLLVRFLIEIIWRSFSFGYFYLQSFVIILFIDACLTDDEPLWEPIEWSLVQTWILFIFIFGWIAENLIVSRYGSYSGRDKRVWMSWYKSFWLIEIYYVFNFLIASIFVVIPFYFELHYSLSLVYSWWNWYSRIFFFKNIFILSLVIYLSLWLQINKNVLQWHKSLIIIILINLFIGYLLYIHFIMSFFGYLTDPVWYQNSRAVNYIQLSHEPWKWGWGPVRKDHFTYHPVKTVFWFKNDGPFASAFVLFHMFLFLSLFFVFIYWVTLFRRVYNTHEIPTTYMTYAISSLKQFFYVFTYMYVFIFLSFVICYWRLPIELFFVFNYCSWILNFIALVFDYPGFLVHIFF